MLEKELKVMEIEPRIVCRMLTEYGASQTFDGSIYDLYFDTPEKELSCHKYSVRVRFQENDCILAFKQRKKNKKTKVMVEQEFVVHDIMFVLLFLLGFGLIPSRDKEKKRVSYALGSVCFDIDMYASIPPLLEIEAEKRKTIYSWIKKLDLEDHTKLTVGSRGLMKYYNKLDKIVS